MLVLGEYCFSWISSPVPFSPFIWLNELVCSPHCYSLLIILFPKRSLDLQAFSWCVYCGNGWAIFVSIYKSPEYRFQRLINKFCRRPRCLYRPDDLILSKNSLCSCCLQNLDLQKPIWNITDTFSQLYISDMPSMGVFSLSFMQCWTVHWGDYWEIWSYITIIFYFTSPIC